MRRRLSADPARSQIFYAMPQAALSASTLSVCSQVNSGRLTSEVTVRGGLAVDGTTKVKFVDDRAGTQVEHLVHRALDGLHGDMLGAERLHHNRDGARHADGVGDLNLAAIGEPGCNDVFATQRAA